MKKNEMGGPDEVGTAGVARRGFFSLIGRILAGGAVAVLAGWLLSRGGSSRTNTIAGECVNKGACGGCGQIGSCGLPQGELARRWQKESGK